MTRLVDLTQPTPARRSPTSTSPLAGLIPLTWLLVRFLHGLRPRWLSSVLPRLRWGYLFVCFGLSFLALFATILVAALLPQAAPAPRWPARSTTSRRRSATSCSSCCC